jgi:hypothetical protein
MATATATIAIVVAPESSAFHDFGEDRLLGGAGIGVAEIRQQVQQIDPGFPHRQVACGGGRPCR